MPNGFYTNRFGRGIFTTHLDFDPVRGAYPFEKVAIPGAGGARRVVVCPHPRRFPPWHCVAL